MLHFCGQIRDLWFNHSPVLLFFDWRTLAGLPACSDRSIGGSASLNSSRRRVSCRWARAALICGFAPVFSPIARQITGRVSAAPASAARGEATPDVLGRGLEQV